MTSYRKIANDIEKKLKAKMSPERRAVLLSAKKRMELWAKAMEEDDTDALMELAIERGIASRESWEQTKKELKRYEEKAR